MANFSATFTRTSPAGSISRNKDFTDAELDRLNAAVVKELQSQGTANPTNGQIADYTFGILKARLIEFTKSQEAQTATTIIMPIGL